MQLTIPNCPMCQEIASHAVDLAPGKAELMNEEQGPKVDFDYAGGTEINWDSQTNALLVVLRAVGDVVNDADFMLVGCPAGHQWITGVESRSDDSG